MEITKLTAFSRDQKVNKVRQEQFVPGVIYGKGVETASVKFKQRDVEKLIKEFGARTNLMVSLDGKEDFGFIRDTARDVLSGKLLHLDIQVVNQESEITRTIPLIYKGAEALIHQRLVLQTNVNEIQLTGKATLIPNVIEVDISDAQDGDSIGISDINLPEGLTCINLDNVSLAVISAPKSEEVAETDEADETIAEDASSEQNEQSH